jgi:hypothetical protein
MLPSFEVFWCSVLIMNINDELAVVDAFEERNGIEKAIDRACEFLIRYLSLSPDRLSEIARRGLEVAMRYRARAIGLPELGAERSKIAVFLSERSAWTEWRHPDYGPIHSVYAILWYLEDPTHGGGASEVISNAFEATKAFRPNDATVRVLLRECFQAQPP